MLARMWNPLKSNGNEGQTRKKISTSSMDDQGLRALIQLPTLHKDSNILLKSNKKLAIKPIFILNQTHEGSIISCFLKSCNLCNKTLRLDKQVFMYRGDQGFCSEECRGRQIYLDEIRELENSTKKTLASYRRSCRDSGQGEAASRWRSKHFGRNTNNDRVIFLLS